MKPIPVNRKYRVMERKASAGDYSLAIGSTFTDRAKCSCKWLYIAGTHKV
jgi:hypothetical protein